MTWRRFIALTSGLSFESRWAHQLRSQADEPVVLDDPDAAEAYFRSIG